MSEPADIRTVRGRVEGRVQGVAFRASMQRQARRAGVRGWVRNRADGAVEFLAEGNSRAVEELLGWARQGPAGARVQHLSVDDIEPALDLDDFEVRF